MLVYCKKAYRKEFYDVAPDAGKNPYLVLDFYVQDWLIQFLVVGCNNESVNLPDQMVNLGIFTMSHV
jgi:hypothetical protein